VREYAQARAQVQLKILKEQVLAKPEDPLPVRDL
jgi:hypothetical protein